MPGLNDLVKKKKLKDIRESPASRAFGARVKAANASAMKNISASSNVKSKPARR